MIIKQIFPRFHLLPLTQQCNYDVTLDQNDHMIIQNILSISPATVDSTMQLRLYLRTKWFRWLNNATTTLPLNQMTIWLWKHISSISHASVDSTMQLRFYLRTKCPYDYNKILTRFHLLPLTQQCNNDFTLEPNEHMIIKKSSIDFTCFRWLNNATTTLPWNQMTIWL